MVEGGQRVISTLLAISPPVVDTVIVTVAPLFVGKDGTGVTEANQDKVYPSYLLEAFCAFIYFVQTLSLEHLQTITLGQDAVIACKVAP